METSSPSAIDLSAPLYYQLVYTLTDLLPPPLDDSPEALRARNHAAVAKVAALLPVNANEIDLAAQCIAARGQAEEMLRLVRRNAGDVGLVLRLNAQYGSMVRTSLSVLGKLMRVQAVRQKREAIEGAAREGAATEDAWTGHVAERSMMKVVDPKAGRREATRPEGAPVVAPVEAPAGGVELGVAEIISKGGTHSHRAAFETPVSEPPWKPGAEGSGETGLREGVRDSVRGVAAGSILARSRDRGRELPANGR